MNPTRPKKVRRKASATVELAVCLPMLVTLGFGSIQACNALFLKHALTTAAYEGTLEAAQASATPAKVRSAAQRMLTALGVRGSTVTVRPNSFSSLAAGSQVTVIVTAPVASNLTGPTIFPTPGNAEARGVCMR